VSIDSTSEYKDSVDYSEFLFSDERDIGGNLTGFNFIGDGGMMQFEQVFGILDKATTALAEKFNNAK